MTLRKLIPDSLIELVIARLTEEAPWVHDQLTYEVQDDFKFLLIKINAKPGVTEAERKKIGRIVDNLMPARENELSWMVNFVSDGKTVDSYFGGDTSSPDLGF